MSDKSADKGVNTPEGAEWDSLEEFFEMDIKPEDFEHHDKPLEEILDLEMFPPGFEEIVEEEHGEVTKETVIKTGAKFANSMKDGYKPKDM